MDRGLVSIFPTEPRAQKAKAEAAAWLARLRADDRSVADERAFQAWLAADPSHAAAFDGINAMWETAGGLAREAAAYRAGRGLPRRAMLTGFATLVAAGAGFSVWESAYAGVYETEVGEQKHVSLEDGTQVFLDTDTRIRVNFTAEKRSVELARGRANFRVAPDSARPFVVEAAGREIIASRTTFDARRDGDRVSVVLISGHAALQPASSAPAKAQYQLTAGERVVATAAEIRRDKPNLLPLLAWQTGQAIFENEKLADAAAEMNRYTTVKLVVADSGISGLRISGVYRVGDNTAFARSVAALLPVTLEIYPDHVELSRDVARMPEG
jgi:transmembrane sensor